MPGRSNPDSPAAKTIEKPYRLFLAIGFAASAILMIAAIRGDLWLDEVMSLKTALTAPGWLALITQNANDNNHLLNTFFLRLLGWQQHLFVYRLPAVLFGIYTIVALAWTARRWSREAAVWIVYLAGLSYPVIVYSSEARGYAPAMFFAVVSFETLQQCWEHSTWSRLIFFWTSLCLGCLSHFSFIIILVALGGWSLVREKHAGSSLRGAMVNLAKLYAVPTIFLAGIFLVFIRHITFLGGPVYSPWEVVGAGASYALGLTDTTGLRLVSVFSASALVSCAIWNLFRQKRSEWIFFGLVLFVAPGLVVFLLHPKYLYVRYFMVSFPFFYLLLAFIFAEWFRKPAMARMVPVLLVLAITTGHLLKVATLLNLGRGNYRRALDDMAAATPGQLIRVSSDCDFQNERLLRFYGFFLPPAKQVEYIPLENIPSERPDWIVVSYLPPDPSFVMKDTAAEYDLFSVYPSSGLTGMNWWVYRLSPESVTNHSSKNIKPAPENIADQHLNPNSEVER